MRNKKMCKKCKYHSRISVGETICCAYSLHTGETNLKRDGDRIIDNRGYDMNNCLKFTPGKAKDKAVRPM